MRGGTTLGRRSPRKRKQRALPLLAALAVLASVLGVTGPPAEAGPARALTPALVTLDLAEDAVLFSGNQSVARAGGVEYRNEDVVSYDPATGAYAVVLDGSDLGLEPNLNGFALLSDGSFLLTYDQPVTHPELGRIEDTDIVRFFPTSLGADTAGAVEWFLDGSDVGLDSTAEQIENISVDPSGRLVVSTRRTSLGAANPATSRDLIVLDDAVFGATTSGNWSLYFRGADVGLERSTESLAGVSIDPDSGDILFTTTGDLVTPGFSASRDDIVRCEPSSLAPDATACALSVFLAGKPAKKVDALHVGPPSVLVESCTPEDELRVESHTAGQRVDTSETGTGTGSFILSGTAPDGATSVMIAAVGETAEAELSPDGCAVAWSLEVTARATTTVPFTVVAQSPSGEQRLTIDLDIVAADEDDVLVQPEFAFTPQFHDRLVSFDGTTGVLVFSGDITPDIEAGDGLGGGSSGPAPDGYLRIVLTVTFDGTNTVVTTRQADLTEFVRQIEVDFQSDPDAIEPMIIETGAASPARASAGPAGPDGFSAPRSGPPSPVAAMLATRISPDPDTSLDVIFDIDPGVEFELDIDWSKPCWVCPPVRPDLKRIWFEGSLELQAAMELTYTGDALDTGEQGFGPRYDDFRLGGLTIPTPIGIPIHFTFEAESQAFYQLTLSAAMRLQVGLTFRIEAGFEYDDDGSGRGSYSDASFTGGGPTVDLDVGLIFEAKSGLEIDFEVLLYGQGGIEIEARPQLVFEAIGDVVDREIKWELVLEVPFEAGVEIEIKLGPFGIEREFGDIDIVTVKLTLFKGTIFGDSDDGDLALTYSGPPGAFPGQEFGYSARITNNGAATATGVSLAIVVPAAGSFVSSTPGGSPASPAPGSTYTIPVSDIGAGQTRIVTLRWKAPTPGGVELDSSATVRSANAPTDGPVNVTVPVGLEGNCFPCGATAAGTGLRNRSQGVIDITGLPAGATVTRAVLIWGILYNGPTPANTITFDGTTVTADVGSTVSGNLCWGDTATIGYGADVTSLVTGNGSYVVSDPPRGITRVDNNPAGVLPYTDGASLVVFYVGGGSKSQVLSTFTYNTNTASSIIRSFSDINSAGLGATLTLAGPDGQGNGGERFTISGAGTPITLFDTWNGSDPQQGPSFTIGNLWDTDTYDVGSVLPAGQSTLTFSHVQTGDCIGVGAAVLEVDQP